MVSALDPQHHGAGMNQGADIPGAKLGKNDDDDFIARSLDSRAVHDQPFEGLQHRVTTTAGRVCLIGPKPSFRGSIMMTYGFDEQKHFNESVGLLPAISFDSRNYTSCNVSSRCKGRAQDSYRVASEDVWLAFKRQAVPRPRNVPLLRALWSPLPKGSKVVPCSVI